MQLHRARERFEAAGARLVLIGQLTPEHAAEFRRRQGIELTVLADSDRASYKVAGTKVGRLTDLISPKTVVKSFIATAKTGRFQTRTTGHPAQLGGTLVIAQDGRVIWSHIAVDASDNASPEQILAALGTAR